MIYMHVYIDIYNNSAIVYVCVCMYMHVYTCICVCVSIAIVTAVIQC